MGLARSPFFRYEGSRVGVWGQKNLYMPLFREEGIEGLDLGPSTLINYEPEAADGLICSHTRSSYVGGDADERIYAQANVDGAADSDADADVDAAVDAAASTHIHTRTRTYTNI
ncbi:hypothetical protein EVAR_22176_1 [Eumeta japonica]|uniref:Uncharacterized protein n=1 Tax=Eumeta variegata TaxID=151549 RepID=A0A4C1XYK1_EUMVA|nr:hypothetical protein EVAR_22176_1 [Eumeta japonica]